MISALCPPPRPAPSFDPFQEITPFIPKERQFTDAVRTFAYGTDASFYR